MRSKKGFTLIELLAVIIILGVIMTIVVPRIGDVFNSSYSRAYELNLEGIEEAARGYVVQESVTIADGETITATIPQMINAGVLDEVKDPKTKQDCEGYVTITRSGKRYIYRPYMRCGENYISANYDQPVNYDDPLDDEEPGGGDSVDTEAPIINILGNNPISINVGDAYDDAGATATDDYDGNLTTSIVTTSTVNTSVAGSYTVTYSVTDSDDKTTTAVRTVNVIGEVESPEYSESKGVNKPVLATGMTPIKWNGTDWVTTTESDVDWYNYTTADKKWANARTADGSMWVWIPRFIYAISYHWHNDSTGTIDIQFSFGFDDTRGGTVTLTNTGNADDSNGRWTSHPAFTFGTTELPGIWVAKFEASIANTSDICYTTPNSTNCNITTALPKVVPGVLAWKYIQIGNAFTVCRNMEISSTYGWGTTGSGIDTHMMKNVEWGAVAYLSKSTVYGRSDEIDRNDTNTTGAINYLSVGGQLTSSTGNLYGIYDISGGLAEFTSAYVNNGSSSLITYGFNIMGADSKYKDVYSLGSTDCAGQNYALTINKKGDAIYETSDGVCGKYAWYSDYSCFPQTSSPWFNRGGYYSSSYSYYSGAFNFDRATGSATSLMGFRPVLLVKSGL